MVQPTRMVGGCCAQALEEAFDMPSSAVAAASAIVVVLVMLFLALFRPGKGIVPEALRAKDYQPRRRLCQQATTADAYEK
jgi:hypothetical protein